MTKCGKHKHGDVARRHVKSLIVLCFKLEQNAWRPAAKSTDQADDILMTEAENTRVAKNKDKKRQRKIVSSRCFSNQLWWPRKIIYEIVFRILALIDFAFCTNVRYRQGEVQVEPRGNEVFWNMNF